MTDTEREAQRITDMIVETADEVAEERKHGLRLVRTELVDNHHLNFIWEREDDETPNDGDDYADRAEWASRLAGWREGREDAARFYEAYDMSIDGKPRGDFAADLRAMPDPEEKV